MGIVLIAEDLLLLLLDDETGAAHQLDAPRDLVNRVGKNQQETLTARLVERGILEQRDTRVLGIFPRHRWPAKDTTHEDQVRRALQAALIDGQQPDERTAALVALLAALDRAHKVVERGALSARGVRRRAKEISEGDWAAKGVRDAIQAAIAAMSAASAAGASVAATGAS